MTSIRPGAWRDGSLGSMQVVSDPMGQERVHYEAPEASRIDGEMRALLAWFNRDDGTDPVQRAALAHLWFATIHPFDNRNGRIARTIADMALARSEDIPRRFDSISGQIRVERKAHYDSLEATRKGGMDVTAWIAWFLGCLDRAFIGTEQLLAGVLSRARFWERHGHARLHDRQRLVPNRMLGGFEGKPTSSKYARLANCSQDTASRDIADLTDHGFLARDVAGGRSTGYSIVDIGV